MNRNRPSFLAGLLLLAALGPGLTGCAGSGFDVHAFRDDVARGDYEAALDVIGEQADDDDVANLLDRALLLSELGRYRSSNALFDVAEHRIDDLYTRSLTDEGLSLLVNDWRLDYRAAAFEHAYIAYYRTWNYLEQGMTEDALVEVRKIDQRLSFRSRECPDTGGACGHDTFLRYFCGLVYEWAGRDNDALVSYRLADEATVTMWDLFGVNPPADLGHRLVLSCRRMGLDEEASAYAERYGVPPDPDPTLATVAVFVENGLVGMRQPVDLLIPIFKRETVLIEKEPEIWAEKLADRAYVAYEKSELDYLLKISIPTFVRQPPVAGDVRFTFDFNAWEVERVADLSGQAEAYFQAALGGILVRAVARGITKYLAKETAENEVGEWAGIAVNWFGVATEHADTRSWRSLPAEIRLAAVSVTPGTYDGSLVFKESGGPSDPIATARYEGILLEAGNIAFVRYRGGP